LFLAGSGCGGALTNSDGTIQSPNYPSPYNHNAECVWVITVGSSDNVVLSFSDFDVEGGNGCPFDYVEVHNQNIKITFMSFFYLAFAK
jgi:hypothetical protein